jgi:hypothetical protein
MVSQFHLIASNSRLRIFSTGNYGYMVENKTTKTTHSRVVTPEEAEAIIHAIACRDIITAAQIIMEYDT